MIDAFVIISKNKLAYRHSLTVDSPEVAVIKNALESGTLDFSSNIFREYDGRLVTQFDDRSPENIVLLHLKYQLKKAFNVSFSNRNKIIEELFDKLRVSRSLKDLSIIKFDFKNYFYSVSTEYIYDNYIQDSRLSREDKDYIDLICKSNRYCVAGLPVFNYFIEMISADFDKVLRAKLSKYGLVYYERYVDDGVVILNKYIPKKDVRKILNQAIEEVFRSSTSKNKVKLNEDKFVVINRRYLKQDCVFSFLGYEFFLKSDFKKINVGITKQKRSKYQEKVNKLIKDNFKPGDKQSEERVRHLIKAHSSRVVYFAPSAKHRGVWVSKGIIANYNKLKDYPSNIDRETSKFLKEIYFTAFRKSGFTPPHYLNNPRYSLLENMSSNRAMIFNELIGTPKDVLIDTMTKAGMIPNPGKDYNYLVKDYLIHIKIGY